MDGIHKAVRVMIAAQVIEGGLDFGEGSEAGQVAVDAAPELEILDFVWMRGLELVEHQQGQASIADIGASGSRADDRGVGAVIEDGGGGGGGGQEVIHADEQGIGEEGGPEDVRAVIAELSDIAIGDRVEAVDARPPLTIVEETGPGGVAGVIRDIVGDGVAGLVDEDEQGAVFEFGGIFSGGGGQVEIVAGGGADLAGEDIVTEGSATGIVAAGDDTGVYVIEQAGGAGKGLEGVGAGHPEGAYAGGVEAGQFLPLGEVLEVEGGGVVVVHDGSCFHEIIIEPVADDGIAEHGGVVMFRALDDVQRLIGGIGSEDLAEVIPENDGASMAPLPGALQEGLILVIGDGDGIG